MKAGRSTGQQAQLGQQGTVTMPSDWSAPGYTKVSCNGDGTCNFEADGTAGYPGGGNQLNPNDAYTTEQQKANDDSQKAQKQLAQKTYDLGGAFLQLFNQAALASHNLHDFGQNLLQALPGFANSAIQGLMPGPMGLLFGGIAGFLLNMLTFKEQSLPVTEGAMNSRIINWNDAFLQLAGVRQRSELSFSKRRMEVWRSAAQGAA